MTNYPTSLDSDTELYLVIDNIDDVLAVHHNSVKDAIIAIETALGITGAFNFATDAELSSHTGAGNPHSTSASDSDLSNHMSDTSTHGVTEVADAGDLHNEGHVLAVTGPHTGTLPLADLAVGSSGSIIIRGAADWEELVKADDTDVLTLVSGYPTWAAQGAPGAHDIITTHTDTGLTIGNVIRASGAATFVWAQLAHGDLSGIGSNAHSVIDTHLGATNPHSGSMPNPSSSSAILVKHIMVGHNIDTFNVTNDGGQVVSGSVWCIGDGVAAGGWVTNLDLPVIAGWSREFRFACRMGYVAGGGVCTVGMYNRTSGSAVTGSNVALTTNTTKGGFGVSLWEESGAMTEGATDLDVVNADGYQFYVANSVAGKTTVIHDMRINIYLVKD